MFFIADMSAENISKVKDIVNIVTLCITIIGGAYGLFNFIKSVKANFKDRKIKNFKSRVSQIDRIRSASTKKCLNEYKKIYHDEIDLNNTLVVRNDWLIPDNVLFELSNINVKLIENQEAFKKSIKSKRLKIFPDKKLNYSELLIKYSDKDKSFFNGDVYCTHNINKVGNTFNIDIFKSDYFSFVDTCKVLELMNETDQSKKRFKIDVLDFKNRHSGIGINAVTIFNNVIDENSKLSSYFAIHQRTSNVVESPNSIHVVPAGTYSPVVSIQEENLCDGMNHFDHDLKNTLIREFLEEVWQSKHMKELGSIRLLHENPKYYILKYFTKIFFLGLGIEPYNTKTEILAALIFNMNGFTNEEIDSIISSIDEKISDELKVKIKSEVKTLFKSDFNFSDFDSFLMKADKTDSKDLSNEGDIRLEPFTKGVLEQYYSDRNVTPSAKEIFRKVYHLIDKIKQV